MRGKLFFVDVLLREDVHCQVLRASSLKFQKNSYLGGHGKGPAAVQRSTCSVLGEVAAQQTCERIAGRYCCRLYLGCEKRNGEVITDEANKWSNLEYFRLTGLREYAPYMMGGG